MYKKFIASALGCVSISLILFILWYAYGLSLGYSCTGNVNFHKNNSMFRISTKLTLFNSSGTLSLNGVLIESNGNRQSLNRTIFFNSKQAEDRYTWISEEISPSIDEKISGEILQEWFPAFYVDKGGKIELYIKRININSIIISGEFLPYLICTKKH